MNIKNFTAILGILLIVTVTASHARLKQGELAPSFTLKSLDGKVVSLKSLLARGHVMLVFWETECVYCYIHIKDFNAIHNKYKNKGLTVAAINMLGESNEAIQEYVNNNKIKYLMLSDQLKGIDVANSYKVIGTPTIVLIAPDGRVLSYGYDIPDVATWLDKSK